MNTKASVTQCSHPGEKLHAYGTTILHGRITSILCRCGACGAHLHVHTDGSSEQLQPCGLVVTLHELRRDGAAMEVPVTLPGSSLHGGALASDIEPPPAA